MDTLRQSRQRAVQELSVGAGLFQCPAGQVEQLQFSLVLLLKGLSGFCKADRFHLIVEWVQPAEGLRNVDGSSRLTNTHLLRLGEMDICVSPLRIPCDAAYDIRLLLTIRNNFGSLAATLRSAPHFGIS